jgi:hypothetical protein
MPVEDRAADTWEPLVAVADHAHTRTWPTRARAAVLKLTGEHEDRGRVSTGARLLTDIHAAFAALGDPDTARTEDLLTTLNTDPEAPWAGYGPHGLTGKRLADLLREYDIRSTTIRFPVGQAKGYARADFHDAWTRYTPTTTSTTRDSPSPTSRGRPEPPGVSVPNVPSVPPQVSPGTDSTPGTDRSVPTDLGTDRSVPPHQSVPPLTCTATLGTDGTGTPRRDSDPTPIRHTPSPICLACHQPLTYDDGTHTHPTCTPTNAADRRNAR